LALSYNGQPVVTLSNRQHAVARADMLSLDISWIVCYCLAGSTISEFKILAVIFELKFSNYHAAIAITDTIVY